MRKATGYLLLALVMVVPLSAWMRRPPTLEAELRPEGGNLVLTLSTNQRVPLEAHYHAQLDGGKLVMIFTPTYTFEAVGPGVHSVQLELVGRTHTPRATKSLAITMP